MSFHFRVYDFAGALKGVLPEFATASVQEEFCNQGAYSLDYPVNGLNASLLSLPEAMLVPVVDGVEEDDWYVLEDDGDDPAPSGADGRLISVSGRGALALFEDPVVYPGDWAVGQSLLNKSLKQSYAAQSPGAIMLDLIYKAQLRGCLQNISVDFTTGADSDGHPWPTNYSVDFDVGTDYGKVLASMADEAWAEFRMSGTKLRMFVPGTTMGTVRSNVMLRLGREVTAGPRKRSRRTVRDTLVVAGDEGALVQVSTARIGRRREAFDGRGGITDIGTLTAIGQTEIAGMANPREGITLAYVSTAVGSPQPYTDYGLGDYITYDQYRTADGLSYLPMRVRSIAREFDTNGLTGVSIEVNDLIMEIGVALARKIDVITNASTGNSRAPEAPVPKDTRKPKAPAAISVATATYTNPDGHVNSQATITWTAVTQNTDNSNFDDFGTYEVQVQVHGEAQPRAIMRTPTPAVFMSPLPPAGQIDVSVRAVDATGNASTWATSPNWALANDTDGPAQPSKPTVVPYLGTLRVLWDGAATTTGSPPLTSVSPDFDHVDVWMSQSATFAGGDPSTVKVDSLPAAGAAVVTGLTPGTSYYFLLIPYDRTGNIGTVSAISAPGVPRLVGSGDVSPAALANTDHSAYLPADVAPGFTSGGTVIADPGAYSGNGRRAAASQTLGGVNYTALKPGRYRASWVLKTANLPATLFTIFANLDVTGTNVVSDGALPLYRADLLPTVGTPRTFSVRFTVTAAANSVDLPVALTAAMTGTVEVMQAYIEPVSVAALMEITDAQIGSVGVGKLVAGLLQADMTVSARIKTADTGSRVEIGGTGLFAYGPDPANPGSFIPTLAVFASNGAVGLTGPIVTGGTVTAATFQTGSTGARVVISPTGAVYNSDTPNDSGLYRGGITMIGGGFSMDRPGRIMAADYNDNSAGAALISAMAIFGGRKKATDSHDENWLVIYPRNSSDDATTVQTNGVLMRVNGGYLHYFGASTFAAIGSTSGGAGIMFNAGDCYAVNASATGYVRMFATSTPNPSDPRVKTAIAEPQQSSLELLRSAEIREYRLRDDETSEPHERRMGLMATDLPERFRINRRGTVFVDPMTLIGLGHHAIVELDHHVRALTDRLDKAGL